MKFQHHLQCFPGDVYRRPGRHVVSGRILPIRIPLPQHQSRLVDRCSQAPHSRAAAAGGRARAANLIRLSANYYDND